MVRNGVKGLQLQQVSDAVKILLERPPAHSWKRRTRHLGHKYTELGGTVFLFSLSKQHYTFLLLFFKTEELPFLKDHRQWAR